MLIPTRKKEMYLELAIDLSIRICHVMAMHIEAKRGEKRHEEHISLVSVQHPDNTNSVFSSFFISRDLVMDERPHHIVLNTVLPLYPGSIRPGREGGGEIVARVAITTCRGGR